MPGRNLQITATHDIGPQPDAHRICMSKLFTKFFKVTQAVNIDMYTHALCFFNFSKMNTVTGVQDIFGFKTGKECKLHFINRTAIYTTANTFNVL